MRWLVYYIVFGIGCAAYIVGDSYERAASGKTSRQIPSEILPIVLFWPYYLIRLIIKD